MKIFLGTAGIPLSSKATSTAEGVKAVAKLGLNAMEVEFVQKVYLNTPQAKEVGKVAHDYGVRLTVHAPYYINLCSKSPTVVTASNKRIAESLLRADAMEADAIAVHVAYYCGMTSEEAHEKIKAELAGVLDSIRPTARLGIETMARKAQFGELDEILRLSKEIPIIPYIDWAHIFVRNGGNIDYAAILDKVDMKHVYSHFEGVAKNKKGQFIDQHIPIVFDTPPFEPLARELLERNGSITIVCESPMLEHDCLLMKKILDSDKP